MNAFPSNTHSAHVVRLYSEYIEMPGLRLTCAQAQRLCGLNADSCIDALQTLVDAGFLRRTDAGQYIRLTDGSVTPTAMRMVKAQLNGNSARRVAS